MDKAGCYIKASGIKHPKWDAIYLGIKQRNVLKDKMDYDSKILGSTGIVEKVIHPSCMYYGY